MSAPISHPEAVILIVDDSRIVRHKVCTTLRDAGYHNLHEADSGEEALELVEEIMPHLFLLDMLMPGMDGLELCQTLKQQPRFAASPIIFVTGTTEVEMRWKGFEVGAVDYIPKPFHPYEILARVNTHLDLSMQAAGPGVSPNLAKLVKLLPILEGAHAFCEEQGYEKAARVSIALGALRDLLGNTNPEDAE